MIVQKNFLSKLKDFGLNTYESKIWTALLSRGVSTAGELSDIANVPRSRSYDVLESLEKKGFIIMKLGKPIKYLAVPPEEVVDRVKKRIHEDTLQKEKQLEELNGSETLTELMLLFKQGVDLVEPTDLAGSIRGRENIYNHMESMIKNAQKSVFITTSSLGFERKASAFSKAFKKAKERGVEIIINAPIGPQHTEQVNKLSEYVKIKNKQNTDTRTCIVDNKEALIMVTDDSKVHPSYEVGIWMNAPYFTSALSKAINQPGKQ
ncbi:MAG: helix-turn-helix domain-containing protein [archaeon]